MSKNKKDIPMWAKTGHSKPVTRREFLAAGIIPFAASVVMPNWMSLILGNQAHAQTAMNCDAASATALIPFITFNLAGGAAMSSNYLPMNAAGEPLSSYDKMGLGNNQVPIEREFGNVPFAGMSNGALLSTMLTGIRRRATAATLANTAFIAIPCDSANDTDDNKFDITGAITKAGLVGTQLPNLGAVNSRSGIGQAVALVSPPSPLVVNNVRDLATSIGYTASLNTALNTSQKQSLAKLVSNLNSSQTTKLNSIKGAEGIKKVLDCAGIKNVSVIEKGTGIVDPLQNKAFSDAFNVDSTFPGGSSFLVAAAVTYNALLGQAGTASIEFGGYDYHDNTRSTGNELDDTAGEIIGSILESARVLNKPVFLYVVSDGSVSSPVSTDRQAPWTGDRGANGVSYIFYFNPAGRPATSGFQIGSFNNNQAADTNFITGGNPEMSAAAVFANWCQANKRIDLFEKVLGRVLDSTQLAQVIKIA